MPIKREDVESIIATVPGFQTKWQEFLQDCEKEDSPPWYIGMGELSHYVVEKYTRGETAEFPALFASVEVLLRNPDPELENLIQVGLLEDIQNVASHRDFGMAPFRQWLGPKSLFAWDEICAYIDRVDAMAAQQKLRWWQFWLRRKAFNPQKALAQVESPELRKIMESMFRKRW